MTTHVLQRTTMSLKYPTREESRSFRWQSRVPDGFSPGGPGLYRYAILCSVYFIPEQTIPPKAKHAHYKIKQTNTRKQIDGWIDGWIETSTQTHTYIYNKTYIYIYVIIRIYVIIHIYMIIHIYIYVCNNTYIYIYIHSR